MTQLTSEVNSGIKSGVFGGVALFAVIFFASGVPRVQRDILQKIPFLGSHYIKEIPASDNVRNNLSPITDITCVTRALLTGHPALLN